MFILDRNSTKIIHIPSYIRVWNNKRNCKNTKPNDHNKLIETYIRLFEIDFVSPVPLGAGKK